MKPEGEAPFNRFFALAPGGRAARLRSFLLARRVSMRLGIRVTPMSKSLLDMEDELKEIHEKCREYTMTSIERMYSLCKSIDDVVSAGIPGAWWNAAYGKAATAC